MRVFGMYVGVIEFLITLNTLTFILTLADETFFLLFALMPSQLFFEPWTLLTSMFTHASFNHLLFNMIALFFLGSYLERIIGEKNFLRVYFIGGLGGGILTLIMAYIGLMRPDVAVVGASGAVFSVAACLAILRPNLTIFLFPIPFPMPLYLAVFGFMLVMSFMPGIAWSGHLGGLIVGALYGLSYKGGRKQQSTESGIRRGYRFY